MKLFLGLLAGILTVASIQAVEPDKAPSLVPDEQEEKNMELEELLEGPLNNEILHQLILRVDPEPKGQLGFWQFKHEGVELMCMTDETANRMRIMASIKPVEEVTAGQMAECMKANFDRALDARYCVNHDVLWGTFIHPLSTLRARDFFSAVHQVVGVKKNFGTSYSSGGLLFRGGEESQEQEKKARQPVS